MKRFIPWGSYAVFTAAVLVGLVCLDPDKPASSGLMAQTTDEILPSANGMERERIATLNQMEARIRVARQVMAAQLTLLQGAEELRDLHSVNPYFHWEIFRTAYTGTTDLERCCQQLQDTIENEKASGHECSRKRNSKPVHNAHENGYRPGARNEHEYRLAEAGARAWTSAAKHEVDATDKQGEKAKNKVGRNCDKDDD